jgi:hypothetical protein
MSLRPCAEAGCAIGIAVISTMAPAARSSLAHIESLAIYWSSELVESEEYSLFKKPMWESKRKSDRLGNCSAGRLIHRYERRLHQGFKPTPELRRSEG